MAQGIQPINNPGYPDPDYIFIILRNYPQI